MLGKLYKKYVQEKEKGALAIEATISFSIFITFLVLLMAIVKMSLVYITINDVTAATTKKIAGMAYPISFFNEFVDETAAKVTPQKIASKAEAKILKKVGKSEKNKIQSPLQLFGMSSINSKLNEAGIKNLLDELGDKLFVTLFDNLETKKEELQTQMIANIYEDMLEKTQIPIDMENVEVRYFAFPQSKTEFKLSQPHMAEITGLPKDNFSADDVVLVVDYDYDIVLPFFPKYTVPLRCVSVERGWVNGGNQVVPSSVEGLSLDGIFGKMVYYTTSGNATRYHKSDGCFTLSRSASIKRISIAGAKAKGLKPCKICKPDSHG